MPDFGAGANRGKFCNFFLKFGTEGRPGFGGVKTLFPDGTRFFCGGKGGEGVTILRLYKSANFALFGAPRKSPKIRAFCDLHPTKIEQKS